MQRKILATGLMVLALSLAACGGDAPTTDAGVDPAAGTCLEGTPDCDDTGILDGDAAEEPPSAGMCAPEMTDCDDTGILDGSADGDVYDSEAAVAQAQELLGRSQDELGPDVRIARQGEEWMMLTEDYRIGRMTVELDLDDMDRWIVTSVTVELPDAPQTFTRHLP